MEAKESTSLDMKVGDMSLESDEKINSDKTEATDWSSLSTDIDTLSKSQTFTRVSNSNSTDFNHIQFYEDPKITTSQPLHTHSHLAVYPNQSSVPSPDKFTPIPTSQSFVFRPVRENQPPDISQTLPYNTRLPISDNARTKYHKNEKSRQNISISAIHISDSSASRRAAVSRGTSPITTISPQDQDDRSHNIPIPSPVPYYITRAKLVEQSPLYDGSSSNRTYSPASTGPPSSSPSSSGLASTCPPSSSPPSSVSTALSASASPRYSPEENIGDSMSVDSLELTQSVNSRSYIMTEL